MNLAVFILLCLSTIVFAMVYNDKRELRDLGAAVLAAGLALSFWP